MGGKRKETDIIYHTEIDIAFFFLENYIFAGWHRSGTYKMKKESSTVLCYL